MHILRNAWCLVVKAYGVERLAVDTQANVQVLRNKATPTSKDHRPTLEDFELAAMFTADQRLVDPLCAMLGGVFVKTAGFEGVSDQELLDEIAALGKEYADVPMAVSAALADGNVDQGDLERVSKQIYELNQRAARIYARLASMKRESKFKVVK